MRSAAKRGAGAGCARVAMTKREAARATARQIAGRQTGRIFMVAYPIRRRVFDPAGGLHCSASGGWGWTGRSPVLLAGQTRGLGVALFDSRVRVNAVPGSL